MCYTLYVLLILTEILKNTLIACPIFCIENLQNCVKLFIQKWI